MKYIISFFLVFFSINSVYAWVNLINSQFYNTNFIKIPSCSSYDKDIKYYDALAESYDIPGFDEEFIEASEIWFSFELKKRECVKQKAMKKDKTLLKQMWSICLKAGGIPLKKFTFNIDNLNWINWDWTTINLTWKDVVLWITTKIYFGRLIMSSCDCKSKWYDIFAPAYFTCHKFD